MDFRHNHLNGSINLAAEFLRLSVGAFLSIPTRDYPHGTTLLLPSYIRIYSMNEPPSAQRVVFRKWSPGSKYLHPYALELDTSHLDTGLSILTIGTSTSIAWASHKYEARST